MVCSVAGSRVGKSYTSCTIHGIECDKIAVVVQVMLGEVLGMDGLNVCGVYLEIAQRNDLEYFTARATQKLGESGWAVTAELSSDPPRRAAHICCIVLFLLAQLRRGRPLQLLCMTVGHVPMSLCAPCTIIARFQHVSHDCHRWRGATWFIVRLITRVVMRREEPQGSAHDGSDDRGGPVRPFCITAECFNGPCPPVPRCCCLPQKQLGWPTP